MFTETLRKYPILPFLERKCCSKYELPTPNGNGTITLPAGTGVYIPVLGIHHDPTYYPEPEKFDPDRFTEENKRSRPNYTYLPFGEGPRMCIGKYRRLIAPHNNFRFDFSEN
jgi:cytochrome P450 family 6